MTPMAEDLPAGGSWIHSFEEDEADVQVYRPAEGFAFPPSRRGREAFNFDVPGQVATSGPGPDDRTRTTIAPLTALGMGRYRIGSQIFEVVEVRPDLLKLRTI